MRPETGPMQFDDDWRGVFIRGDNALMGYLPILEVLSSKLDDQPIMQMQLKDLMGLLASAAHTQSNEGVQMMKKFSECKLVKLPTL